MEPETVGALLTGLTSLVVAVGGVLIARQRRAVEDVDTLKREIKTIRVRFEEALGYIYRLRETMLTRGLEPPPIPEIVSGEPSTTEKKKKP